MMFAKTADRTSLHSPPPLCPSSYRQGSCFLLSLLSRLLPSNCVRLPPTNLLPPPLDRINSCCAACRILVPCPGFKPVPPAVEAQSPNHWTAREAPTVAFLQSQIWHCFPRNLPDLVSHWLLSWPLLSQLL